MVGRASKRPPVFVPPIPKAPTSKAPLPKPKPRITLKTWADYNERARHDDRVLGIQTPEGRYVHASCADMVHQYLPGRPMPQTVMVHMISKVAASGGLVCVLCDTFIVPPRNKRGIERAEAAWLKANESFHAGRLTYEEWLVAAQRYASSRVTQPDVPTPIDPTQSPNP